MPPSHEHRVPVTWFGVGREQKDALQRKNIFMTNLRTATSDESIKVSKNQLCFPISRVKKIIRADTDITQCQGDAVLMMTALAEVFVDHLTRQSSRVSDAERRKTITYRDVALTVGEDPRLSFLEEVIPKTVSLSEGINRKMQLEMNDPFPIDAGDSIEEEFPIEDNDPVGVPMDDDGNDGDGGEEDLHENRTATVDFSDE